MRLAEPGGVDLGLDTTVGITGVREQSLRGGGGFPRPDVDPTGSPASMGRGALLEGGDGFGGKPFDAEIGEEPPQALVHGEDHARRVFAFGFEPWCADLRFGEAVSPVEVDERQAIPFEGALADVLSPESANRPFLGRDRRQEELLGQARGAGKARWPRPF